MSPPKQGQTAVPRKNKQAERNLIKTVHQLQEKRDKVTQFERKNRHVLADA